MKHILWIPGFNDTFIHQNIISRYLPALSGYRIHLIHPIDYSPDHDQAYSTSDFKQYIDPSYQMIQSIMSQDPEGMWVMYGHSTGYLIVSLLLRYTDLASSIHSVILNDPYVDNKDSSTVVEITNRVPRILSWLKPTVSWLADYTLEHIHIIPSTWKFKVPFWRFNKESILYPETESPYKKHLRSIEWLDQETKSRILIKVPASRAGFYQGSANVQREIDNSQDYIDTVPVLLLIAGGSTVVSELSKKETKRASMISSKVRAFVVKSAVHDVLIPDNSAALAEINTELERFLDRSHLERNCKVYTHVSKDMHDRPLVIPNALMLASIWALVRWAKK